MINRCLFFISLFLFSLFITTYAENYFVNADSIKINKKTITNNSLTKDSIVSVKDSLINNTKTNDSTINIDNKNYIQDSLNIKNKNKEEALPYNAKFINNILVAYVRGNDIFNQMPDKRKATDKLLRIKESYNKELKNIRNEYNKKYSDYMTYGKTLTENLKLLRMRELTSIEQKMQELVNLSQKDLLEQEELLIIPLKQKIKQAIDSVGREQKYTVIYDIDNPSVVFVTGDAVDATPFVKTKLGIK